MLIALVHPLHGNPYSLTLISIDGHLHSPLIRLVDVRLSSPFLFSYEGILGGQRSSSGCYEPNYDPDDGSPNTESCDESIASRDEESVLTRKKLLEDALFGFFRKEAIKSLKIVQNSARMSTLKLRYYTFFVLIRFVCWIIECVETMSSQIIVANNKIISISKDSVHCVLGLPNCGDLAKQDKDSVRNFILPRFSLTPNNIFFGDMLISSDFLSEEDTFICFMIHTEFLTLLIDSKHTSGFDFYALVYDWILTGIIKYVISGRVTSRIPKVFDFCSY
ncbi:hypothetical protein VPH35_103531 [Triticum aestivum]